MIQVQLQVQVLGRCNYEVEHLSQFFLVFKLAITIAQQINTITNLVFRKEQWVLLMVELVRMAKVFPQICVSPVYRGMLLLLVFF